MLERVRLENIKCFTKLDLEMRTATILTGQNSGGKSTVLQSLLMVKQSADNGALKRRKLQVNGQLVRLGTANDILSESSPVNTFSIRLNLTYSYLSIVGHITEDSSDQLAITRRSNVRLEAFPLFFEQFWYVPAERFGPRTAYPRNMSREFDRDLGHGAEFAFDLLASRGKYILNEDDPRNHPDSSSRGILSNVEAWLNTVSPGVRLELNEYVEIDQLTSTFSFVDEQLFTSRQYRASNVGFGVSYVLPVIASLICGLPGGLVIIENPEAHVHPAGQVMLGELAGRAAQAGVQVICETHSEHFVNGMRLAVKNGVLEHDRTVIHYFVRRGTRSIATELELDSRGKLSKWPPGFFDQYELSMLKLI